MTLGRFSNLKSILELLTVVGFLGTLSFVGVCSVLLPQSQQTGAEWLSTVVSRQLATEGLPEFPAGFRVYFDEHFAFRKHLVRGYGLLSVSLFHTSSSQDVVLGDQGWLFFSGDNAIRDFRNVKPFKEAELAAWADVLERRRKWLAARGSRYVFTVVPNGQTIYPEFVPRELNRVGSSSR